ncbi:hypothetical protein NQZ68_036361 [Dissostichus eleginoides]|nr:hypothetical protein NQZ68_036361 [Dissostichus eleginoides]
MASTQPRNVTCILNSPVGQWGRGHPSQVTLCLSSDKWQVKPGGAHRHIPQSRVNRNPRPLVKPPPALKPPSAITAPPPPLMHPLFSTLAAPGGPGAEVFCAGETGVSIKMRTGTFIGAGEKTKASNRLNEFTKE